MNFEKKLNTAPETPGEPEMKKITEEEFGALQKLGSRAKGLARALTFFTAVNLAGCTLPKIKNEESNRIKPATSAGEVMPESEKPKDLYDAQINAARQEEAPSAEEIKEIIEYKEKYPPEFLKRAHKLKGVAGIGLAAMILEAKEKSLVSFLGNASNYEGIQGLDLKKEVNKAIQEDPTGFLLCALGLKSIMGNDLKQAILEAAPKDYFMFLTNAPYYKDILGAELKPAIIRAGEAYPWLFLSNAPYVKEILGDDLSAEIAKAVPVALKNYISNARKLKQIMDPAEWQSHLEAAFAACPGAINEYGGLLESIKKPELESTAALKNIKNTQTAILLNDMVKHGLSEDDALKIVNNEDALLKALVKIKCEPDHLGRITVEENLKTLSLQKVKQINDLHEEMDAVRFKSVNDASPEELYNLSVYGEEEIFTSTFNGFFNRMTAKMSREKLNGDDLLKKTNRNKFRTFIKECAGFNRLNEFLQTMSRESAHALLTDVVSNLDAADDKLAQATTVADIFGVVNDEKILTVLQEQIKLEYDRVSGPQTGANNKILYGILAGMFGDRALVHKDWFKKMSYEFKLGNFTEVKSTDLFNSEGLNVQQYLFYNDKDGHASFKYFMAQYKDERKWRIEKKDHYAIISSVGNGKKIAMYASYPEFDRDAPDEIEMALKAKNIRTHVMVHRGHSYHTPKTIDGISSDTKIVSLGGCGGYNNLYGVLERSINAHIISTKGTGSMYVNDPLFKMLNEAILSGKDISWPEFWASAERRLGKNPDFRNYVAPHKNLGVMFLKTYNKELERAKDQLVAEK
ncbi:MAG: hypothetical protein V1867_01230 [Candidatus Falkowbacteria bacterium]